MSSGQPNWTAVARDIRAVVEEYYPHSKRDNQQRKVGRQLRFWRTDPTSCRIPVHTVEHIRTALLPLQFTHHIRFDIGTRKQEVEGGAWNDEYYWGEYTALVIRVWPCEQVGGGDE